MAIISRPGKEGNATTYQGKVAAGYTNILAQEVDADIDAIFSAWNAGVDTVNIKNGAVGPAQLAPGAVSGSALAPLSVGTAALADGAVTTGKLADGAVTTGKLAAGAVSDANVSGVSWSKISTGAVQNGQVPILARGLLLAEGGGFDIQANTPGSPSYDNTKPSYLLRLDYAGDSLMLFRAPPPGTAFAGIFQVSGVDGKVYATLADGSVARTQLGVNAAVGASVFRAAPNNFVLTTPGVYTPVQALAPLTTRGGMVFLFANPTLSASAPTAGALVYQRWLRDGNPLTEVAVMVGSTLVPLPPVNWLDTVCPPGSHVYTYQTQVATGASVFSTAVVNAGGFYAIEVG